MTDPSGQAPKGRRASAVRERRIDLLLGLAIAAPVLVAVSLGLVGGEENPVLGPQSPADAALTSATVVCPSGLDDAGPVRVTRTSDVAGGELAVATAAPVRGASGAATTREGRAITVAQGSSVAVPGSTGPTVLSGRGKAAPGIVAGREGRLAVPECRAPSYDEWLVGVGASARHATVVELVNPDDGDAVVDLALHGAAGPVEEPALRGIEVPAHGVKRVDLARVAPREEATAAHLTVVRGRVTVSARTIWDPLGRGRVTTDFLPADAEPATTSLLLGLPDKPDRATLQVANPGVDEVRVALRLVTEQATFTPTDAPDIAVPAGSTETVDLTRLLRGAVAKGVVGLELEATGPVASSFLGLVDEDLVLLAPAPELQDPAAVVVPSGAKSLVLGGARRTAVVHVTSYDARGRELADEQVEIGADRAATLALPAGATSVAVLARATPIRALVLVPTGGRQPGLATLRVRPAEVEARIPVVLPE